MADPVLVCLILLLLFVLLGAGVWVGLSLLTVALGTFVLMTNAPAGLVTATTLWGHSHSWTLASLPMFILMGEVLLRSRLSQDMFNSLAPWLGRVPGRLLQVNVLGCAIFATVSGSSAATAATIGRMSIPELTKRGYPESLILGTLVGSATLGFLIPPSIILIVYGVATEQSIVRLFIAGIIPGILLTVIFCSYVGIRSLLNPNLLPPVEQTHSGFLEKLAATRPLIPVILLVFCVVGSMYAGIASPTDAAAVGVVLSIALAYFGGGFGRRELVAAFLSATRTSCMIAFILMGASLLAIAMGFTGIPRDLAAWIGSMGLSQYSLIAILTLFFVVLGCFLDGISLVVLTTSIIMPMISAVGIDPIWFGIYLVLVVEMSQITPPVGFNLFVVQNLSGRNILQIAAAAFPFFCLLLLTVLILTIFPSIVTWLPQQMPR